MPGTMVITIVRLFEYDLHVGLNLIESGIQDNLCL